MSILAAIFTWLAARRISGPVGGLAALFGILGGSSMSMARNAILSEVPATLACAFLLFIAFSMGKSRKKPFIMGVIAGFALLIRYPLAVLFPALIVFFILEKGKVLENIFFASTGFALPLLLLLWWHWKCFGSPFSTGYSLWLPRFHEGGVPVFSLSYALEGAGIPGGSPPNIPFYLAALAGKGQILYAYPCAAALAAGLYGLFKGDKKVIFCFTVIFLLFLLFSVYFYQEPRLLVPAVPFALLAGVYSTRVMGRVLAGRKLRDALVLILAAANFYYAYNLIAPLDPATVFLDGDTRRAKAIAEAVPKGSVLVTRSDFLFYSHMLPGRRVLPLDLRQEWAEGIAFWEYKRVFGPKASYKDFKAWSSRHESLPVRKSANIVCFPAVFLEDRLKEEVRKGTNVFLDPWPEDPEKYFKGLKKSRVPLPVQGGGIYKLDEP